MISKKIILIGDFSTGKTSLIRRFVDNQFSDTYLSTIGVKISRKQIPLEHVTVQGLIWDIEGGTELKPVNETYILGAHGCILVADITRSETIDHIAAYIEIIQRIAPSAPFVLALNKSDLYSEPQRKHVYEKVLQRYSGIDGYIYLTSAKNGEGVERMFESIATLMMDKG
jgi:small GTP-binding protein